LHQAGRSLSSSSAFSAAVLALADRDSPLKFCVGLVSADAVKIEQHGAFCLSIGRGECDSLLASVAFSDLRIGRVYGSFCGLQFVLYMVGVWMFRALGLRGS
jgi:hypothetical protein